MAEEKYTPPEVWEWDNQSGGKFTNINRPVSGATHEKDLPRGKHPLQLYSLGTPNGMKVTVLLEELLALGHEGAEYDAFLINIGEGDQFGSGFVAVNPNSKIPALLDVSTQPPIRVFESAAIMVYLAEKFGELLPTEASDIAVCCWYGTLVLKNSYNAAKFLDVASYKNVIRWAEEIAKRPAFKRGIRVNRAPSSPNDKAIIERHDSSDLD